MDRISEAVTVYRTLAAERPGVELASLAAALHNLGNVLSDLTRTDEALDAHDESTDVYRKLADPRPDVHDADLADALRARIDPLLACGETSAAHADAREAVAILERLVDGGRRDLLGKLAAAWHMRGLVASALDRPADAVTSAARGEHVPGVLHDHAMCLSELGDDTAALELIAEGGDVAPRPAQ